jgi:hypothetical protein
MLNQLAQPNHGPYELGLVELGKLLGAESFKPDGQGRADAVWLWDDLWLTVEAKSEQTADRLSMGYVRQANTHLSSLAADRGVAEAPPGSVSVFAAASELVDPDAVPIAVSHLYLTTTAVVLDLAHEVHRAWAEVRTSVSSADPNAKAAVARILWEHRILPAQVKEMLTRVPIRGM